MTVSRLFTVAALVGSMGAGQGNHPAVLSAGRYEYVLVRSAATSMSQHACGPEPPGACRYGLRP